MKNASLLIHKEQSLFFPLFFFGKNYPVCHFKFTVMFFTGFSILIYYMNFDRQFSVIYLSSCVMEEKQNKNV